MSLLKSFKLTQDDFSMVGTSLNRPECVWYDHDGLWVSDSRGGIAKVVKDSPPILTGSGIEIPNGFCRMVDGSFLVAGLGDGKLHRIFPNGKTEVFFSTLEVESSGVVNHCSCDRHGRVWISVMTRLKRWDDSLTTRNPDGYIVLKQRNKAQIVADDLDLTNEVKLSPDGKYLYAAESLGRRIVRFPIKSNFTLGNKEVFGPSDLGPGANPDGFTFDEEGNVWAVIIAKNGITIITKEGSTIDVFEDIKREALDEWILRCNELTANASHLANCAGDFLKLPTSLAFGGADRKTVFIGSLLMPHLYSFRSPIAGPK
ncbi:SMP-30/gluconolactonase/LRE family protein [Pedobacter kyonggii]|uniref:SMP-30/gluconolactonase/LRE family protein n=1 Tax=Pedobacter kyonggii TaxID=1926871 RepID=A0A4Q9HGP9_9SPHI|nr:SMP-30/gluconolactonase/LRE family protein [Pedobacter kyonggii]TBO44442.1 SMP-30/gluconolactonase/LRE family protein [Pedobacter kyonggii]